MPSRRLRGLAPEINPEAVLSRAERRKRRSRSAAVAARAADDAQPLPDDTPKEKGNHEDPSQEDNSSSQVAVHSPRHSHAVSSSQAAATMSETNAGGHSEHTGGLDSPHNSSPASPLGILAGVSGLARHMGLPAESPAKSIDNRTYHGPERFACQKPIKFGPGRLNVVDFEIGPCSGCGMVGPVPYDCGCSGAFQSALNKGDAIKQVVLVPSHIDKYESESESDSDTDDSDSSDADSSDSDGSDADSSDSDDSVPVVPKKRVKLVAKKAGGPGASRKRAPSPADRPKKRAKQGGIVASYSKKELKASRALSLDNFIKAKLLVGQPVDERQLRSFVCNTTGKPIGTSPAEMNRAYKAWASTAKGKYVGTGMDGHLKDRCSKQCCANGHRLNVCPALKTHLANKLGRKMTGKDKLWKSGDGFYYYKGAFLKK